MMKILTDFLSECIKNDHDLDTDDIKHVLDGDFDYVRKQWNITEIMETPEWTEAEKSVAKLATKLRKEGKI